MPTGSRAAAKERRRRQLLTAAATIMADRGFHAMRLEDLGEAVGISGPAVYRHFSSKQDILTELLTEVSEGLLTSARKVIDSVEDPVQQIEQLIDVHVDFALAEPELIRLHNRELYRIDDDNLRRVRAAQGHYLGLWATALAEFDHSFVGEAGRAAAQMVAGLLNSTESSRRRWDAGELREVMVRLARGAVGLPVDIQHP
jgi:AcrR family transcriptional regulator